MLQALMESPRDIPWDRECNSSLLLLNISKIKFNMPNLMNRDEDIPKRMELRTNGISNMFNFVSLEEDNIPLSYD